MTLLYIGTVILQVVTIFRCTFTVIIINATNALEVAKILDYGWPTFLNVAGVARIVFYCGKCLVLVIN